MVPLIPALNTEFSCKTPLIPQERQEAFIQVVCQTQEEEECNEILGFRIRRRYHPQLGYMTSSPLQWNVKRPIDKSTTSSLWSVHLAKKLVQCDFSHAQARLCCTIASFSSSTGRHLTATLTLIFALLSFRSRSHPPFLQSILATTSAHHGPLTFVRDT